MAKTVIQGFQELRQRLEITDLQASAVSIRQQGVREAVKKELPVLDGGDFLTGSYIRKTMIAPLKDADIDIFIVLDGSHFHKYNPASLLDKVKETLKQAYSETIAISRDRQYTELCVKGRSGILNWYSVSVRSTQEEDTDGSHREQYRSASWKSRTV